MRYGQRHINWRKWRPVQIHRIGEGGSRIRIRELGTIVYDTKGKLYPKVNIGQPGVLVAFHAEFNFIGDFWYERPMLTPQFDYSILFTQKHYAWKLSDIRVESTDDHIRMLRRAPWLCVGDRDILLEKWLCQQ